MIQSLSGKVIIRFDVPVESKPYNKPAEKANEEAIAKKAFEFEQWLNTVIAEKAYEEHEVGLRVHLHMQGLVED
jgi:hypothetical protein